MPDTTKMSRAEAGRKGGQTTKKRYGDDFFGKIGRMGGKKGGETTKQRYGIEFYQKIGRKGGSAVSKDREHMSEIGHKGGQRVKELVDKGKGKE